MVKPSDISTQGDRSSAVDSPPQFKQRSSIFLKLAFAFIIGSCIPLALAIGVSYEESTRTTTYEIKKHLHELAIGRDAALTEHIEDLKRNANAMAHSQAVIERLSDESATDPHSQVMKAASQFISVQQEVYWGVTHHIFVTDISGRVVVSPKHRELDTAWDPLEQCDHFQLSIESNEFFARALTGPEITGFFGFETPDHYHQLVTHPVRNEDGAVLGVVVIEVSIEYIQDMLTREFTLGDSGRMYLATRTGEMVVHQKSAKRDRVLAEGLRLAIESEQPVVGEYTGADENQVFGVYRPSSDYPWILCVEIDSAEVRRPLAAHRNNLFMLTGIVLAALAGFAVFFSKRFGTPLRHTAEMVERVASGDLDTPIEITNTDEIGLVQAGVEAMRLRMLKQIRTLDERIEDGLRELKFQQMALDEHAIVSVTDVAFNIIYVNKKFCEITGYTEEELIGQNHRMTNSGRHPESFFEDMYETITSGEVWRGEVCIRSKNGDLYWVDETIVPTVDDQGTIIRYTTVRNDITALRIAQERFATAVRGSRDGLWDWNLLTDEVYYAPQFNQMLGLEEGSLKPCPEDWIGLIFSEDLGLFLSKLESHIRGSDEIFECEIRMTHSDGEPRWMLCRGAAVRDPDGQAIRLAGSLAEITDMKEAQRALKLAAEHDRLTNLPNRSLFQKHVHRAVENRLKDKNNLFAVLFFDFDRFKIINDSLGHKVGDELLISIAERFHTELRPYDVAARFGGDEFVVLLNNLSSVAEGEQIADRLLNAFAKPHPIAGHSVKSTASIGLVSSSMDYSSAGDMIRDADVAMYQAKARGRGRVVVFDSEMHSQALDRLALEEDLEDSIRRKEMRLRYQPIIDLDNGALVGFEALVRWQHPERGLVPPEQFVGIAEDNGLIIDIGEWVLVTACAQIMQWNTDFPMSTPRFMSVNISKRQLTHPGCVETIKRVIDESGIEPKLLKIEITESTIVDNRSDIIPTLERIRELGCRLVMDDFGTGHSSLSGLHRLPIDILKIDRSFISSMVESRELATVVHSIVTLAQNLGIDIVAEGLETPDQIAILQSHGVQYGQGYYFTKPLSSEEAREYIKVNNSTQSKAA